MYSFSPILLYKSFVLAMMFLLSLPAAAATAEEDFSAGQILFQKGSYRQALERFKQAHKAGMHSSALSYNLGVSYYKLRQYKSARQQFHSLLKNPSMRPLAALNLGLVEDKLKNEQQAIKWFRQAYEQQGDKKIRLLAWQALGQMGIKLKKPFAPQTNAEVAMLLGTDSNVVDPVNPASNITDSYLEFYTSVDHSLSETLAVSGLFLNQDYGTANSYDFQLMSLNLDKSLALGDWQSTLRGMYNTSTLGGTEYQSAIGAQLQARKSLSNSHDLRLRYRYQQISSASRSYLAGWRMKLRAERIHKESGNRLRYELELNDRADSATSSYSPTRHTLRYYVRERLGENWKLSAYVGYRISDYTQVLGVSRSDQRLRTKLRFKRKLSKELELLAEYSYTDNQSNVASYDYSRNVFALGLRSNF